MDDAMRQPDISAYYREHNHRLNGYGFAFLLLHLPAFCLLATFTHHSLELVLGIMTLLLSAPGVLLLYDRGTPLGGLVTAASAMGICTLGIHLANGMIEAHFEIFVVLALLTIYGRVAVLVVAAVTIALQHVVFWIWLPTSIFNYKASLSIVLVHAFFVVFEAVPACWIARQLGKSTQANAIVESRLNIAVQEIAEVSKEVLLSSQAFAQGALEQAASIGKTAATTNDINVMANQNSTKTAETSRHIAEASIQIDTVNRTLEDLQGSMILMNQSNVKVGEITKIIDQIAFQTNILALNAAVEAARANESGAGFAVVADEVRSLAHRSGQAAKDIAELIEDSTKKSKEGVVKLDQFSSSIQTITQGISEIQTLTNELQHSSQEQSGGVEQVNRSIRNVETVSQSNAANARKVSDCSSRLNFNTESITNIMYELLTLTRSFRDNAGRS